MKKYFAIAKINFKHTTWVAYLVAGICVAAMLVDIILDRTLNYVGDTSISLYSMFYLVPIMAPIFIASINYSKFMNIGVKRKAYFYACIINYVIIAAIVSLSAILEMYLLDDKLIASGSIIYGLIRVFGWDSNVFTAFFSQFAFLLMVESIIHTLTFIQTKWYGWAADILIAAIISVFTPIPVLRSVEVFFFNMTIFAKPVIQITVCLTLAALIYSTNLFYLKKRI